MKRIFQILTTGIAAMFLIAGSHAKAQSGPSRQDGPEDRNLQSNTTISVILEQDEDNTIDAQGYCMIPIRSLQKLDLGSISLVIDYPYNELEIEDVATKIKGKMLYSVYDGLIRISWYSMVPIKINPGDELITLTCRNISLNPLYNTRHHDHSDSDLCLKVQPVSMICDGSSVNMPNVVLTYPRLLAVGSGQ